jgi:DASS family divalent anion:Na+ symporter
MHSTSVNVTPTLEYVDLLKKTELFARLDRVTLARIAAHLEFLTVQDGTVLFRQGDPADGLYIVIRGAFGVFASGAPGETHLNTVFRGDAFGEMALLTDASRSAIVRARGHAEVLRLDRQHFLDLLNREPSVVRAVAATLVRRLHAADAQRLGAPRPDNPSQDHQLVEQRLPEDDTRPPAAPARPRWRPNRSLIGVARACGILLGAWMTAPPWGLTPASWHALATVVALVPLLALNALPEGIVALILAAVWVLGGLAPPRVALGGFAIGNWVLVVSVLAIGGAIGSTGVLYRLALWAMARARSGFAGQVLALGLAGLLVGPAVPNATARTTLVAPAVAELVEALGYAPGGRAAAGLAMAVLFGFGQMVGTFLTSSTTAVLVYAVLPESSRAGLNWGTWAIRAAPTHVLLFLGLMATIFWLYRPRPQDGSTSRAPAQPSYLLALQRALLGPLSRHERIALGVAAALLLGFITQPLHGVDPAWIGVLALGVLAATGVLAADGLRMVNWGFALLFGILISMTDVFAKAGLDRWLAAVVAKAVEGLTAVPVLFIAALTLLCYGISLMLRWQAAAPLLTIALAPVASGAGIDPWIVGPVTLLACNGFFLPYQSTVYLALYHGTNGRLFTHRQARPAALAYGVITLLVLCASVPIWRVMGLL